MRKILYSIVIVLTIGLTGCSFGNHLSGNNSSDSVSSEVVLTQRQMDILEELGLSTNYDELTLIQQDSIVEIENMLSYVEDKYGISFSYLGYYPSEMGIAASMKAYPSSGSKNIDMFTITKTDDGYEDDYINVMSLDVYCDYITNVIQTMYPERTVRVYGKITETSLTEVATEDTCFDGKVCSALSIFVDENEFSEQEFSSLKDELSNYLTEHQLITSVHLYRLKVGNIANISKYDYDDYGFEEYYTDKVIFHANE